MALVVQLAQLGKLPEWVYKLEFQLDMTAKMIQNLLILSSAIIFLAGFKLGQIWQMYKAPKIEVKKMPAELLTSATGAKLHLKGCIFGGSGSTSYAMCKRCSKSYTLE